MEEPPWKKIKLSLERPYKDDNGEDTPALLDITPEGQHIYEPKENPSRVLGENLRRILVERGVDFFEKNSRGGLEEGMVNVEERSNVEDTANHKLEVTEDKDEASSRAMTTDELMKMRMEILPQLFIALGEISHAKELLALLLSSPPQPSSAPASPSSTLSATIVTKPPPIIPVQAFNAQLAIGGKDEALRKAADVFKSAATSMERGRIRGEKYWVDALKIRRGNWGLIPAPLPYGSATGKGADKTSKDFLISFGLEESPPHFRRWAVGHMATYETESNCLVFLHHQHTRLRVSVGSVDAAGVHLYSHNSTIATDTTSLEGSLRVAQQEMVEQEIFSLLVKEAGNLPTASARVSERLIVIDAAQGIELKFELVDAESVPPDLTVNSSEEKCNLIYFGLHALLLRMLGHRKLQRLGTAGIFRPPSVDTSPPRLLLQPIIDLLQYQVFCERVKSEIDTVVQALTAAGIPSTLRFDPVGEIGQELVNLFDEEDSKIIGGEAVLRIDNRHTVRLTFLSPSSLTAHLPQATLAISSIPQFCQLLSDEIERCLLHRICELGSEMCDRVSGTWFVDLSRCVGRWEGCILNFRIFDGKDFSIGCSAFRLDRGTGQEGELETYSSRGVPLLSWVERIINRALFAS